MNFSTGDKVLKIKKVKRRKNSGKRYDSVAFFSQVGLWDELEFYINKWHTSLSIKSGKFSDKIFAPERGWYSRAIFDRDVTENLIPVLAEEIELSEDTVELFLISLLFKVFRDESF